VTSARKSAGFASVFGAEPEVVAEAPGRVNLMGEHTDYNHGWVLPIPIPQQTRVELRARADNLVRLHSDDIASEMQTYELYSETVSGEWKDYVQGVTQQLAKRGQRVSGFDARVSSHVPVGAGLSSSAALVVGVARALRRAFHLELDDAQIAQLGRAAEVDFVGAPVGIMDHMVVSQGHPNLALLIDTLTLATREIALPEALELVVIHSGVSHAHGTGDYRKRRDECTRAAELLGVSSLRELAASEASRASALATPLDRRVKHVLSENERVLPLIDALASLDRARLGELFAASHESMRSDFEITTPAVDRLVEIGRRQPGIVAARMTGGGFGGAVVMLAERGAGSGAARAIADLYARDTSCVPRVVLPEGD